VLAGVFVPSVRAWGGPGAGEVGLKAGPYARAGVPALGGHAHSRDTHSGATIARTPDGWVLLNRRVRVIIDDDGLLSSVYDRYADREVVPAGARANLLTLHRDTPTQWDAWDIDTQHARSFETLTHAESVEKLALDALPLGQVGVRITRKFGSSQVTEDVTLAGESSTIDLTFSIDWHERQKLLRLNFALDLPADRAASEIQFGHIFRPTHANTSWDSARFETVAHRWVHVGEPGFGVAVANDSTYGHSITRTDFAAPATNGGATTARVGTTVSLSLLRAPLYPDPTADQGRHELRVALRVGASIPDAVSEGYRLNLPLHTITGVGATQIEPLFTVNNAAVVIEAVKLAEDGSGDTIVRLYEAHGTRARARVDRSFPAAEAYETDLLERPLSQTAIIAADGAALTLEMRPFQLVTLRYGRG
ncbi:MAG: glycosyl hydrolase-related protein, partial [Cryobacterium sp.]|uniref:glycoside hydrolase family 38 C-terminal domain-containing protein n=1 Tax=Cryobacterium sp. TaxID=1926290 RepID=UPI00229BDA31